MSEGRSGLVWGASGLAAKSAAPAWNLAGLTLVLFDCCFLLLDTSVPDVEKAMSSDSLPSHGLEDKLVSLRLFR